MDRFVMRFLLVFSLVVAAPLEPSTRTWPWLSGHHALAQSTAPAAGAPDQMAPSDAADDDAPDPTVTDSVHGAIAGGVTGTGEWLDSFFGTAHDQAENNKSRVRVSFGGFVEEGSDLGQRLQVKARLALPHTGKRLSLYQLALKGRPYGSLLSSFGIISMIGGLHGKKGILKPRREPGLACANPPEMSKSQLKVIWEVSDYYLSSMESGLC